MCAHSSSPFYLQAQQASDATRPSFSNESPKKPHLRNPYHPQSFPNEFTQPSTSSQTDGESVGDDVGSVETVGLEVGDVVETGAADGSVGIESKLPPPHTQHASFPVTLSAFCK